MDAAGTAARIDAARFRADLDDVVARVEPEFLTQSIEFLHLGVIERGRFVLEDRTRVRERLVEHQFEEFVREVVVRMDVLSVRSLAVSVSKECRRHESPLHGRESVEGTKSARPAILPVAKWVRGAKEITNQRRQVVGLPQTIHVAATHTTRAPKDDCCVRTPVIHR